MMKNPFTDRCGDYPPYFAGRKKIKEHFGYALKKTEKGTPEHLLIVGEFGAGKTVLIEELRKKYLITQKIPNVVTTLYQLADVEKFCNLLLCDSARGLGTKAKVKEWLRELKGLGISILGTGFNLSFKKLREPQSDIYTLLTTTQDFQKDRLLVYFIDQLEYLCKKETEKILQLFSNILYKLRIEKKPILFVNLIRLEHLDELTLRNTRIIDMTKQLDLKPLSSLEIEKAIKAPLKNKNIIFLPEVLESIKEISQGIPFYIQLLSHHTFEHMKSERIKIAGMKHLEKAKKDTVRQIEALPLTKFKILWNSVKDKEEGKILWIISKQPQSVSWNTIKEIYFGKFGGKEGTAKSSLKRLSENKYEGKIYIKKVSRGIYQILNPLFKEYIKLQKI